MNIEHNIVRESQSGIVGIASITLMIIASLLWFINPAFAAHTNTNTQVASSSVFSSTPLEQQLPHQNYETDEDGDMGDYGNEEDLI